MAKIKIIETDSLPICPHCKRELNTVELISKGIMERHMVYMCPHCKSILSIGYSILI